MWWQVGVGRRLRLTSLPRAVCDHKLCGGAMHLLDIGIGVNPVVGLEIDSHGRDGSVPNTWRGGSRFNIDSQSFMGMRGPRQ